MREPVSSSPTRRAATPLMALPIKPSNTGELRSSESSWMAERTTHATGCTRFTRSRPGSVPGMTTSETSACWPRDCRSLQPVPSFAGSAIPSPTPAATRSTVVRSKPSSLRGGGLPTASSPAPAPTKPWQPNSLATYMRATPSRRGPHSVTTSTDAISGNHSTTVRLNRVGT